MATFLDRKGLSVGKVTQSSDYMYNAVYDNNNELVKIEGEYKPTGKDMASNYGECHSNDKRTVDLVGDGSLTNTKMGDVTEPSKFIKNEGTGENNTHDINVAFEINGRNVLGLRNATDGDGDGVKGR